MHEFRALLGWRRTRTSDLRKYNEHILANHNAQISTEIVQNFK